MTLQGILILSVLDTTRTRQNEINHSAPRAQLTPDLKPTVATEGERVHEELLYTRSTFLLTFCHILSSSCPASLCSEWCSRQSKSCRIPARYPWLHCNMQLRPWNVLAFYVCSSSIARVYERDMFSESSRVWLTGMKYIWMQMWAAN